MTGGREQVEEGMTASGKDVRTVGKPPGKAPDMQNVQDVTETVMEERVVEEIPLNNGEVHQWEAAEQPPLDHESDQGKPKYKEDLVEANQRADRLEFIREFWEMMDQAFEKLLSTPVTRYPHQKDKPELCMEQGKHKESICREAERLPQPDVSRDSV